MSDPQRTDGSLAPADASPADRDAKIEQLLVLGLDHYFAARYELAINVWTRALFLDRSHARARAYIDRARSALAEQQRESEELLHTGVAAFNRGEGEEARRLLQAAIDRGAPSEEALAVLERLNRLESVAPAAIPAADPKLARRLPASRSSSARASRAATAVAAVLLAALAAAGGWAGWARAGAWTSTSGILRNAIGAELPAARSLAPVVREAPLPLPRRGEEMLSRARSLAASGHLHEALATLDRVRLTDLQRADADRLRGEIQRQLLALTSLPASTADREKAERGNP